MKVLITRSQVAQLYVELTNDNLKESFLVEGDELDQEQHTDTTEVETPTESTSESNSNQVADVPASVTPAVESTGETPVEPLAPTE